MPRTINESITQLETSLSDIKTSLTNKNVEGGGTPLKVSEVAGLIDQIEAGGGGGGGSTPFTYIDYIEYKGQQYKDNFSGVTYTSYDTSSFINITFKIKLKERAFFANRPSASVLTVEPSVGDNDAFEANTEYTCTITDSRLYQINGLPFVFSTTGYYEETYKQPDFFFVRYNYEGE